MTLGKGTDMGDDENILEELNDRSREVFRRVVEGYLASGEPVGSRTLTRTLSEKVSAATVRNVMQDLEFLGLLGSPHVSAGRIPTQMGLRMFVDGFLEVGDLQNDDRQKLDQTLSSNSNDVGGLLDRVSTALSGVTQGASIVLTPKHEAPIRHLEFVNLGPDRALVVLVFADGQVENRLFTPPPGQTPSSMREAANFLNAHLNGQTLPELKSVLTRLKDRVRHELDQLSQDLVGRGLAVWSGSVEDGHPGRLIVRGRANLLEGVADAADIDRLRMLFDDLE